jgi:hypothetical protein
VTAGAAAACDIHGKKCGFSAEIRDFRLTRQRGALSAFGDENAARVKAYADSRIVRGD